jgi:chromosome partitioning protein
MTNPLIITCASSKGGVGKSTTAACLAGAFAKSGETVHLIDLDNNGTLSRWMSDDRVRPRAITVATPDPEQLSDYLKKLNTPNGPDVVIIDIAGTYERGLTVAIARSHLTLIPSTLSEADVFEAHKVAHLIRKLYAKFGGNPLYRLILTRVQPLKSHAQRHALNEIKRLQIPMLESLLVQRAAYEEIGLSGVPPHYADPKRSTIAAAIEELDRLLAEIKALIAPAESSATGQPSSRSKSA